MLLLMKIASLADLLENEINIKSLHEDGELLGR